MIKEKDRINGVHKTKKSSIIGFFFVAKETVFNSFHKVFRARQSKKDIIMKCPRWVFRSMAALNDKAVGTVRPTKIMSLTSFSYLSRDLEPWSLLCFSSCGIE